MSADYSNCTSPSAMLNQGGSHSFLFFHPFQKYWKSMCSFFPLQKQRPSGKWPKNKTLVYFMKKFPYSILVYTASWKLLVNVRMTWSAKDLCASFLLISTRQSSLLAQAVLWHSVPWCIARPGEEPDFVMPFNKGKNGKQKKQTDSSPWKVFFEPMGLRLPEVVEQLGESHIVWQVVGLEELLSPNVHGWIKAPFALSQALGAVVLGEHFAEEAFVGVEPARCHQHCTMSPTSATPTTATDTGLLSSGSSKRVKV